MIIANVTVEIEDKQDFLKKKNRLFSWNLKFCKKENIYQPNCFTGRH